MNKAITATMFVLVLATSALDVYAENSRPTVEPVDARSSPPEWLTRNLNEGELKDKPVKDLRLMRNTIYARHGRQFQDPELQRHFAGQPWYRPDPNYTETMLTDVDRHNIGLIQKAEGQGTLAGVKPEVQVQAAPPKNAEPKPEVEAQVVAEVKPYTVSPTLAEVENLHQFKVDEAMRALLTSNLFAVAPADHWQPFFVYENNDYRNIPSFVTVDSVLHLYHLLFSFALRNLEEQKLLPLAEKLTSELLNRCRNTYEAAPTEELREAALRNLAYVLVGARLLEIEVTVLEKPSEMVKKELDLIAGHKGFTVGAILPYAIDYTQFVPRGHYTRTESLKRYFKAMLWYGLFPFTPRYRDSSGELHWAPQVARQGLLLTHDLYAANLTDLWDKLYTPINFFVGFGDDLTPAEVKQLSDAVFGGQAGLEAFSDASAFEKFKEQFVTLRMPRIKPKFEWLAGTLPPVPDPDTPQLRLLGQRYTPDSNILQELSHPTKRPVPKGLDVMAVFGSPRAQWLLDQSYKEPASWDEYLPSRKKLAATFGEVTRDQWTQNLYWNWLWVLKSLIQPFREGYPSFMRNEAWQDKGLQTALASWAQLRHDTILYVKQSLVGAECGGEEPPPPPKGYVEPNPEAFGRLLGLAQRTRAMLLPRGLLTEEMGGKLKEFEDMVVFLKRAAEKELRNETLAEDEYDQIRLIGSTMDYLALWIVSEGQASRWDEVAHPADRNMACIADVHTAVDRRPDGVGEVALEEGVGHAFEIYVIAPIEGKLYLTRGAVFSYYEFLQPMSDRLTDEAWQEMLKNEKAPPQPVWMKSFTTPKGEQAPAIAEPVNFGC